MRDLSAPGEALLTFPNIHGVMAAEKTLLEAGLEVRVMPLPGKLGRGCGMGLRLRSGDAEQACGLCPGGLLYVQGEAGEWKTRTVP